MEQQWLQMVDGSNGGCMVAATVAADGGSNGGCMVSADGLVSEYGVVRGCDTIQNEHTSPL